jgi:hypothetical protein
VIGTEDVVMTDTSPDVGSGSATPTQSVPRAGHAPGTTSTRGADWIETDFTLVKIDVLALAERVVSIIRARDLVAIQKSLAKLTLQHAASDEVPSNTKGQLRQDYKNFDEEVSTH